MQERNHVLWFAAVSTVTFYIVTVFWGSSADTAPSPFTSMSIGIATAPASMLSNEEAAIANPAPQLNSTIGKSTPI